MYLHKENRELFSDVVILTSERMGVAADIVEKDYLKKLICEVRRHRCKMDEQVAPSARADVDMKHLIHRLCEEDFYKQDYADTTIRLISDALDYETVRNFFLTYTEDLF